MTQVTLTWDGRPRPFDLDKLETAWLMFQDCETALTCMRRLSHELNWERVDAIYYTTAIKNKLWSPK